MTTHIPLIKGTRLRHINRPEWGIGQLLEDGNRETLHVFFENKGEMNIAANAADKLTTVSGPDAQSMLLDNLYLPGPGKSRPMVTMAQAKLRLQERFAGGLHGPKMKGLERDYKDAMRNLALQWYSASDLQALLQAGQHPEVVELAYRLVKLSTNNFPSHFEKMAFGNGLKAHTRQSEFAQAFCAWVLPAEATQSAFEAFARELDHLGAAKWPILTVYRFLLHPQTDVLIKPENLRNAAEMARFEINYRSELNWITYERVMAFYRHVRAAIADLAPTDNIDVQNFIWCIDPDQYPAD